jgi:hypothetical protein
MVIGHTHSAHELLLQLNMGGESFDGYNPSRAVKCLKPVLIGIVSCRFSRFHCSLSVDLSSECMLWSEQLLLWAVMQACLVLTCG